MTQHLRLITWNVNGIRACIKKGFSAWLQASMADVVCLQETKAYKEQVPLEGQEPEGYHAYWHSGKRPGYSGVACYSREKPQEVIEGLGEARFDDEGRCLQLIYKDWAILNNYVPNGGNECARVPYKLDYYQALLNRSLELQNQGKHVILTGDWNTCHREIDLARPKANGKNTGFLPEERAWIDKFLEAGHVDTFRHQYPDLKDAYSWWSNRGGARENNVGWRLDYFLVNQKGLSRCIDNRIHPTVLGSDHCPVELVWSTT
jgi:exodeoxyribonuclease III